MLLGSSIHMLAAGSEPDTVIIRLSGNEEIRIIASSGNELEQLSKFDLNQIIRELNEQARQNDPAGNTIIVMEDTSGTRYVLEGDFNDEEGHTLEKKLEKLERELERLSEALDEDDEEEKIRFNNKKPLGTSSSFVFEFGLNNYFADGNYSDVGDELYAVNPVVSWYVALGSMNSTHIAGPLSLDWGANVSWYNFKFDNERTRVLKTDEGVLFYEDPTADIEPIKSKIVVPYLNAILVPMFIVGKHRNSDWSPFSYHENDGFRIGLGAYAGYRLGGRAKYVVKDEGDRERDKDITNFFFSNWRYGARLQMGFKGIDLFANYDLNELFIEV